MYTRLVSQLVFPLQERLKKHDSVQRRQALERSQWLSRPELLELQVGRLRAFLEQVGREVPYYRQLFANSRFDPSRIQSVTDLQALPMLTKAQIKANCEALRSVRAGPLMRHNTGGSSGEPLIFYVGLDRVSHDVAAKWRATRWWDVDIGDREVVVWGSPIEVGAQDRVRRWRDRLMRTELLPAFEMSDSNLDRFVERIRECRPSMLFGYPSALSRIARHAEGHGIAMNDLGIRVAFVTSERLYDEQRSAIERCFGCRVANGYGGRDAGFIAHECPSGGMHITAEDVVVELVDEHGRAVARGSPGEIVVTHLATGDFPFVRYRTGDIAVADDLPCTCGRGLPMLKELQGRTTDFVVAADGTVMHGLSLIYILRDAGGMQAFKVVQHSLHQTSVHLVVGSEFDRGKQGPLIVEQFKRRLGQEVRIDLEYQESIPPEKSGKFRYIVSHVGGHPAAARA
jgi:phenylacetate-CoA ligase